MENQSNFYLVKEHIPREVFGWELPDWLPPQRKYSIIHESQGTIDVNRFNSIADLVEFWDSGHKYSPDELYFDQVPEGYEGGRLVKLSIWDKIELADEILKRTGPDILLP